MVGSGEVWQTAICPVANAISRIEDMLSVRVVTFHILMQPFSSRHKVSPLSSGETHHRTGKHEACRHAPRRKIEPSAGSSTDVCLSVSQGLISISEGRRYARRGVLAKKFCGTVMGDSEIAGAHTDLSYWIHESQRKCMERFTYCSPWPSARKLG